MKTRSCEVKCVESHVSLSARRKEQSPLWTEKSKCTRPLYDRMFTKSLEQNSKTKSFTKGAEE